MANTYTALFYHIVFSTKNRAPFIKLVYDMVGPEQILFGADYPTARPADRLTACPPVRPPH